jgi:hypothetical protein
VQMAKNQCRDWKIRGAQNAYGFIFIQRGLKPPQKHGPKVLIRKVVLGVRRSQEMEEVA